MVCSDEQLISRIKKEACNISLETLYQRHFRICISVLNRYRPAVNSDSSEYKDLEADVKFLVYNAAVTWDSNRKTKYSTWLAHQTRYRCLNLLTKMRRHATLDFDALEKNIERWTNNSEVDNPVDSIVHLLSQIKDERIRQVYELRYFSGESNRPESWTSIARKLKMSIQTAINLHERGRKLIKKKLESCCFPDRI